MITFAKNKIKIESFNEVEGFPWIGSIILFTSKFREFWSPARQQI